MTFSTDPGDEPGPFFLQPWDRLALLNGQTVTLGDATISRVADLGAGAHPIGIATLPSLPNKLFVLDAGANALLQIDRTTEWVSSLAQFAGTPESVRPLARINSW